jgi:hypothetical protein
LNIYFCERLFGKVLLIEKNCGRKSAAKKLRKKKCDRKITTENSQQKKSGQKKCGRKIAATTWLGSIYERYGTYCLRYVL